MEKLTEKEESIMQIFWEIKKGFVKDVIAKIEGKKPPYNTVSSIVRILAKKKYIGHKQYGNTYEYFPIIKKKDYGKSMFKSMFQNYFDGSYKKIASFIAKENKLSKNETEELLKIINESENKS